MAKQKCILIIQARMGSTRLPGKVLKDLNGKPLLQRLMERLSSSHTDEVVIATTVNSEDDAIEKWCKTNDIDVYRGSDWDVLSRFYSAAALYNLKDNDLIVRVCADNPLHHYDVINFGLSMAREKGLDYFSNSNLEPDFLEDGFDTEVFRYAVLKKANEEADLLSQREHVCPYMKQVDLFNCYWEKYRKDYNYKLSVDTDHDFKLVEEIFKNFEDKLNFTIDDVMAFLSEHNELLEINQDAIINSGYAKSLKEDKKIK